MPNVMGIWDPFAGIPFRQIPFFFFNHSGNSFGKFWRTPQYLLGVGVSASPPPRGEFLPLPHAAGGSVRSMLLLGGAHGFWILLPSEAPRGNTNGLEGTEMILVEQRGHPNTPSVFFESSNEIEHQYLVYSILENSPPSCMWTWRLDILDAFPRTFIATCAHLVARLDPPCWSRGFMR